MPKIIEYNKKKVKFTTNLNASTFQALVAKSDKEKIPMSEIVRRCVENGLDLVYIWTLKMKYEDSIRPILTHFL